MTIVSFLQNVLAFSLVLGIILAIVDIVFEKIQKNKRGKKHD
jgi:hypothetical protein